LLLRFACETAAVVAGKPKQQQEQRARSTMMTTKFFVFVGHSAPAQSRELMHHKHMDMEQLKKTWGIRLRSGL